MKIPGVSDYQSLSARRAWIEIFAFHLAHAKTFVALREESVDRNIRNWSFVDGLWVALREESVDRNC